MTPREKVRDLIARAIAKGVDATEDLDSMSADYRDEMFEGADEVLKTFHVHGEWGVMDEHSFVSSKWAPDHLLTHARVVLIGEPYESSMTFGVDPVDQPDRVVPSGTETLPLGGGR